MNLIHSGHMFSNRGLLCPACPNIPHLPAKKAIPTSGDTSAKKQVFKTIKPNNRTTKEWTALAWPTNIQSKRPDGMFGLAKQMQSWGDCWFLAALAAVAHDEDGHKIMQKSIKAGDGGYEVTFMGLPNNPVFISWDELQKCLDENGGDADTRLMELAADKFFHESGNFKSLFIATSMRGEPNQAHAEQCLKEYCRRHGIQDPMTFNPMRRGCSTVYAFIVLTGMLPHTVAASGSTITKNDVMRFLNQYVHSSSGGSSVVIQGWKNPLGNSDDAQDLVLRWDEIRTEITFKRPLSTQQQAFLNALDKWLGTRISYDLQALKSAAEKLQFKHTNPVDFVNILSENLFHMNQDQFNVLQSGVREVLAGRPGFIGFARDHDGTIEGINEAAGTFTYSESNNPELVHAGKLSDLIQAVISGDVHLVGCNPAVKRNDSARKRFEHAGTSRGRRLRQLHNQVVRDGKIDQTEGGPLADLMAMDDSTFRQIYDSDENGVIEGSELKAVQLRVDRWAEQYELTPLW